MPQLMSVTSGPEHVDPVYHVQVDGSAAAPTSKSESSTHERIVVDSWAADRQLRSPARCVARCRRVVETGRHVGIWTRDSYKPPCCNVQHTLITAAVPTGAPRVWGQRE